MYIPMVTGINQEIKVGSYSQRHSLAYQRLALRTAAFLGVFFWCTSRFVLITYLLSLIFVWFF